MTALEWLLKVHNFGSGRFWSVENRARSASNSEIRRWVNQSCFHVNGTSAGAEDQMPSLVSSAVLFPKNASKRVTII